ncbi:hypothetical protein RND81_11G113900 [Saponaria officinalis]|uniref:F-box domain-containing protein n=1 Tax=Saponaria officinalis TaxID=3572 RepID=A0AAW1HJS7_SAPOF
MAEAGGKDEADLPSSPLHVYYRKMPRKTEYNIPQEIVIEILKRVPVESLLRFMCVSKSWFSLITNPNFVSDHLSCQSNPISKDSMCTLFRVNSRLFLHQLHEPIDEWTEIHSPMENIGEIVGCCHGVVCLFDYFSRFYRPLILWNPSIRKAVYVRFKIPAFDKKMSILVNPATLYFSFGFGLDLVSKDYKVVRVCYNWIEACNTMYLHTDICSLSKNGWTRYVTIIEGDRFILECKGVYVNGFIHWICTKKHGSFVISKTIWTFDLANNVFSEIHLPLRVALGSIAVLMSVKMVEDKLAVSCTDSGGNVLDRDYKDSGVNVWVMMEYGNPKSWRRLIDIYLGGNLGKIMGALITGDGKTVVATSVGNLISWDCNSENIENIALPILDPDFMNVYVPSLVLLRCNNEALRCIELPLKKKKKRNKETGTRKHRVFAAG